jgi:hypothetical protein
MRDGTNDANLATLSDQGMDGDGNLVVSDGAFEGGETPIVLEAPKRRVSAGTIILLLVVLLAAVGLYSMRSLAIAIAAGAKSDKGLEETIETFLTSLSGNEGRPGEALVVGPEDGAGEVLVDDRTEMQVALSDVQKNPFVLPIDEPQTDAPAPVNTDTEEGRLAAELAAAQNDQRIACEKAAAKLRLIMIMGGSNPMASISGKIVRVGDALFDERLGVEFLVASISEGAVTLTSSKEAIQFAFETTLLLHPPAETDGGF